MKESNQKRVQTGDKSDRGKKRKDMGTVERLQLLQRKLYQKAKEDKEYRFYVLYDKIFLPYVLEEAYKAVKKKGRGPGIDDQTTEEIEGAGKEAFLKDLQEDLRKRTYRPQAVKRVWIDKEDGSKRPLGIPTIRDRVVQMACKMIIEPLFEADFEDCSHGFRPKRSAHDAMRQIKEHLKTGKTEVYDADLSKYFDTIPHEKLKKALEMRISDPRVLHLIDQWLKVVVIEEGGKKSGGRKSKTGTPQGGVISPLLANIYLHLLDRIVNNPGGLFARHGVKMVRYADDFVLMGERIEEQCLDKLNELLKRMELTINTKKSRLLEARREPFEFLGFEVRYDRSIFKNGTKFWRIRPSNKSRTRVRQKINAKLKAIGHYPPEAVVLELNPIIRGWVNYFAIDKVSYMQLDKRMLSDYLRIRLQRYFDRKSQRKSRLHGQQAFVLLTQKYGLINPYSSSGIRPVNAL